MVKHAYNLQTFYNEDALSFYLLGAFITDGNICQNGHINRASLSSKDKDWLQLIQNFTCPTSKLLKDHDSWKINLYSKEITSWFINFNCIPNKSHTVKFPKIPKKYLADFLRGCMDGDGTIYLYDFKVTRKMKRTGKIKTYIYKRPQCNFYSGSKLFATMFYRTLLENNISCYFQATKPKPTKINQRIISNRQIIYKITVSDKNAIKFIRWLYHDKNILSMPRKAAIAQDVIALDIKN